MSERKVSYRASAEIKDDGYVAIEAEVTARFHRATGSSDGWATIPFRGTISLEKLAVLALYDRKLCLTRNLARESGLKGSFADAPPDVQETYLSLLDIAESEGVNFGAPVVRDPEKDKREFKTGFLAIDPDIRMQAMSEITGLSEKQIRERMPEIVKA